MMVEQMTARELLAEAEAAILDARNRAKEHRVQADLADGEADEREEDACVLRRIIERHEGPNASAGSNGDRANEVPRLNLRSMTRPDAILAVLRRERTGLPPSLIHRILLDEGRTDQIQGVRNALTSLRHRGLIDSFGFGDWRILEPDSTEEGAD